MKNKAIVTFILAFSLFCVSATSQENNFTKNDSDDIEKTADLPVAEIFKDKLPEIPKLSSKEILFKEYCSVIEENYKAVSAGKKPDNMFFVYTNTEKFTLQGLASRCNIPYETIATLNQIENASENLIGKSVILPTVPGLFVCLDKGNTSIEILLQENYSSKEIPKDALKYKINGKNYIFLSNKRFTATERAFFLDSALQLPLAKDSFWVSSEFGKRKNPFSGKMKDHNGIDLAANEGTPVYAIKDGFVYSAIQNDATFGNYIILSHDQNKMTSVYAHLSKMVIEQYDSVRKGDLIGYVGQTGQATGPHLHFEIRQGGKPLDPRNKLNLN